MPSLTGRQAVSKRAIDLTFRVSERVQGLGTLRRPIVTQMRYDIRLPEVLAAPEDCHAAGPSDHFRLPGVGNLNWFSSLCSWKIEL